VVIQTGTIRKLGCGFLSTFHSNYGSIFHHFRDKPRHWSKIVIFHTHMHSTPSFGGPRRNIEPKQLADEAIRFNLGCQRQYSAVICSGTLLFSSSAAEYCAPVWSHSAHTSQVDVQSNSTMRLISGTFRSTSLPWLPVLSNIEPPALRRKAATDKLVEKIVKHDSWPIQPDILTHHCYD